MYSLFYNSIISIRQKTLAVVSYSPEYDGVEDERGRENYDHQLIPRVYSI